MTRVEDIPKNGITNVPNTDDLDNISPSNLSVSILEHFFEKESLPLKKRMVSKRRYLLSLYKSELTDLPENQRKRIGHLESEVNELYQVFNAMDELKKMYIQHCIAIGDKYFQMRDFADKQLKRADYWRKQWDKVMVQSGRSEKLLSCLTDRERKDLEERQYMIEVEELSKAMEV